LAQAHEATENYQQAIPLYKAASKAGSFIGNYAKNRLRAIYLIDPKLFEGEPPNELDEPSTRDLLSLLQSLKGDS
jgi:hypothetical protein